VHFVRKAAPARMQQEERAKLRNKFQRNTLKWQAHALSSGMGSVFVGTHVGVNQGDALVGIRKLLFEDLNLQRDM
jgi:hypothetical protein